MRNQLFQDIIRCTVHIVMGGRVGHSTRIHARNGQRRNKQIDRKQLCEMKEAMISGSGVAIE